MLAEIEIPEVKFGIGLNAGEVVAAHVGDSRRRQYDVVGDTVNVASRLCGQAGAGEIVFKESLLDQLSDKPRSRDHRPSRGSRASTSRCAWSRW